MDINKKITKLLVIALAGIFIISACSSLPGQETPTPEPIDTEELPPLITATGEARPVQWSRLKSIHSRDSGRNSGHGRQLCTSRAGADTPAR